MSLNFEIFEILNHVTLGPEIALKAQIRLQFAIWTLELLQALMWHDLSPSKYHKFKIQAQENNKVRLFEKMTNESVPSEYKPSLYTIFRRPSKVYYGLHVIFLLRDLVRHQHS
jgi:hypothetical protein